MCDNPRWDKLHFKKIYSTIDEFSAKYEELIALITAKFSPDSIDICEIPPILNNDDAKDKIDYYNCFLNEMYGSTTGFEVLNLNSNIKTWRAIRVFILTLYT